MIFYLTIGLLLIITFLPFRKKQKIYFWLICILLITIAGLRNENIGNDTITYVNYFKLINEQNYLVHLQNKIFEPGYILLNYFIKNFSNNYFYFLLITSVIIYSLIFRFIKKESKNYCLSFILFFFLLYYFESMNIIRQYLAVGIVISSFWYVKEKKIIKFIICIILASFFHQSAVIGFLLYPIYNLKFTKKKITILIFSSLIIFLFSERFFSIILQHFNIYTSYIDRVGNMHTASILSALLNFIILIFIYFTNKNTDNKENKFYFNVSLFNFLINFISIKVNILGRIALYFELFNLIIIPNSILNIKISKNRLLTYVIVLTIVVAYFLTVMALRPEWYNVIPYKTSI